MLYRILLSIITLLHVNHFYIYIYIYIYIACTKTITLLTPTHTFAHTTKRKNIIDSGEKKSIHMNANSNYVKKTNKQTNKNITNLQSKRPFHTCHLFLKFDKFKVFNNILVYFSSLY